MSPELYCNWEFCDICTCTEEAGVNWKCIQCLQHLCEKCKHAHIYGKITMEHRIMSKEEKDDEAELLRMYKCETHTDKNVIMYCKDDKQPVCAECIEDDHEGHAFASLGKVADDIRAKIRKTKENRKIIKTSSCPVTQKHKARKEIIETKREIENALNACANEIIDEYDREYQAFEEEYVRVKLDTSADLLCSDDVENLRDVEIIRKSKNVLRLPKPPSMDEDGHRGRLPSVQEFSMPRMELRKRMLQRVSRDTNRKPDVLGCGSSKNMIAVACIYIGICKSFAGISFRCKKDDDEMRFVKMESGYSSRHTESCMVVDADAVITGFGRSAVEEYIDQEEDDGHRILFLGPGMMKDGKVFFISEDGVSFDGGVLLTSILRHLKGKFLNAVQQHIQESDLFWQIVLPEVWSGQKLNYLTDGISSKLQLENWNICSDSDTCVMYWSKCKEGVPKPVSLTNPCIILEVDEHINISTRIRHSDNQSTAPVKPVVCPGFLAIVKEWITIIELLVGEAVSVQITRGWEFGFMEELSIKYCLSNYEEIIYRYPSYLEDFCEIVSILEPVLEQSSYSKHMSVKNGALRIKRSFIDSQVKLVMENTCKHISQMLLMPEMSSTSAILLFGDFCFAPVVKKILETSFPSLPIMSSRNPFNDIISIGAVNIGWKI